MSLELREYSRFAAFLQDRRAVRHMLADERAGQRRQVAIFPASRTSATNQSE